MSAMPNADEQILKELKGLRADVDYIKKHMDSMLTPRDRAALDAAEKDFKYGRTRRLR